MSVATTLTDKTLEVFKAYAKDAPNWNGKPWVTGSNVSFDKSMRGNIADLVKKGLILIHDYEGMGRSKDQYIEFTSEGIALATELGIGLGI